MVPLSADCEGKLGKVNPQHPAVNQVTGAGGEGGLLKDRGRERLQIKSPGSSGQKPGWDGKEGQVSEQRVQRGCQQVGSDQ